MLYHLVYLPIVCLRSRFAQLITQERSLEFTANKILMKVFRITPLDMLTECRLGFGISESKVLTANKLTFLAKFTQSSNVLCQMFQDFARTESGTYSVCVDKM